MSRPITKGWFEEYRCGCVSEVVARKVDLLGYCGKHGDDRRHVHPVDARLVAAEARSKPKGKEKVTA